MTDTDRMVVWLREAMDAAERIARAACWDEQSAAWTARPPQASYERYTIVDYLGDGVVAVTPENADSDGVGQHIALNDPAAVLRRIAADRKTLAEHAENPYDLGYCHTCTVREEGWAVPVPTELPCATIRNLAEGYGWVEETT